MITKEQIGEWIGKLDENLANLHTGAGAVISSDYSKENNALYRSAVACRSLLTLYYSYGTLTDAQINRLKVLMIDMNEKARIYQEKKIADNKVPEKGDKRTRFDAAGKLKENFTDIMSGISFNNAVAEQKDTAPELKELDDKYFTTTIDFNADNSIGETALKIQQELADLIKENKDVVKRVDLHQEACRAKEAFEKKFDGNGIYSYLGLNRSYLYKTQDGNMKEQKIVIDFKKALDSLHRLEILKYDGDRNTFLGFYKNNRANIKVAAEIYSMCNEWRGSKDATDQEVYNNFIQAMGMKDKDFVELGERIATFEMAGRHYDNQIEFYTNPVFTTFENEAEIKKISKLSNEELDKRISNLEKNENMSERDRNMIKLYQAMQRNRELAELGVGSISKGFKKAEASYVSKEAGKNLKRRFKFLTASARIGRKSMLDYYAGDLDIPVMVKAKLGKVSLKYNSENGHVSAGVHTGVLGTKVVGNIGVSLSTNDFLKGPKLGATAMGSAEAYGARGVAKGWIGGKYGGVDGRVMGHIGHAKAEGTAAIGYISDVDEKGNITSSGYGVNVKAGATAAVFQGKVTTGINICGIMVRWETEGYALGVGAKAEAKFMPGSGCRFGLAGCLGLGLGLFLVIDWRGFVDKFKNWRKRSAITEKSYKQKMAEKNNATRRVGLDNRKVSHNSDKSLKGVIKTNDKGQAKKRSASFSAGQDVKNKAQRSQSIANAKEARIITDTKKNAIKNTK